MGFFKKNQKQSISLEDFALILVNTRFENIEGFIKRFNGLSEEVEARGDKLSNNSFLEYLVFELFTDNACFLLALSQEVSRMLFETYAINFLVQLNGIDYKVEWKEFEDLFKKRAIEYHQYLQEYDPKNLKKRDAYYLSGLGKAFAINFAGCKSPPIILMAELMLVAKIKTFYGGFFKKVKVVKIDENYEVVLQK